MELKEAIIHAKEVSESCLNDQCSSDHKDLANWLQELSDYRDLFKGISLERLKSLVESAQKGLLQEFPCKRGDHIYIRGSKGLTEKLTVNRFIQRSDGVWEVDAYQKFNQRYQFPVNLIGYTVFLTDPTEDCHA